MRKKLFAILQYALFLGAGFFLVWWSIHKLSDEEYDKFRYALKTANYYLLIPVFFILIASHLSRAIRWKILMRSMGYEPKVSNTFCAVMIGYLANFAFPRLGEVLKCTILGKYEKVPADKLVGTILVERAIDLVSFFIVIIISLIAQADVVGEYAMNMFRKYVLSKDAGTTVFKLALIVFIISGFFILLRFLLKRFPESKPVQKIRGIVQGIVEGMMTIKNIKQKGRFILHSLFIWGCYLGGTYLGFHAITQVTQLFKLEKVCRGNGHVGIFLEQRLVHRLHSGLVGGLVHDIFHDPFAVVRVHHKVDELGSAFRIVGSLHDDHAGRQAIHRPSQVLVADE